MAPVSGVYIHLPFCPTRCNYCDFATAPFQEEMSKRYLSALEREIREADTGAAGLEVDSVFFGGGTPSLLEASCLDAVLNALAARFSLAAGAEITVEMNPSAEEASRIPAYRSIGVNRLSIGVQSFDDSELAAASRAHTAAEARSAVRIAAGHGVENVSIDLILGLPGQSRDSFSRSLDQAIGLPLQHLSVYMLELHRSTPLHEQVARGTVRLPGDDVIADAYPPMIERLASEGLIQYEVSNFARHGFVSRHNLKYWHRVPVIGFGLSAASFDGVMRWSNSRSLGRYLERVESGLPAREEPVAVDEEESLRESLFLGLRLSEGVPLERLQAFWRTRSRLEQRWDVFSRHGWVEMTGSRCRLTAAGFLVSNEILSELV